MKKIILLVLLITTTCFATPEESGKGRFFLEGDGKLSLINEKTGGKALFSYRDASGLYPETERKKVGDFFRTKPSEQPEMSYRLISLLDYIEDHYQTHLKLVSGYRSPVYNENLRKNGKLAAEASLHMEGMAADVRFPTAVLARKVWTDLRQKNCCGVGYYGNTSVHVDPGPARFWTQQTSKVGEGLALQNKLIVARTDLDIYHPSETIKVKIIRVTEYPVSVSNTIEVFENGTTLLRTRWEKKEGDCFLINKPDERIFHFRIPETLKEGSRLQIQVSFCEKNSKSMPSSILSNEFLVTSPNHRNHEPENGS